MILPPFLLPLALGVVCASVLAALLHLWRGRTRRDLFTAWLVVQAGFWLGHLLGILFSAPFYTVGDLQIVAGFAGGGLAIALQIVAAR